MTTVLYIGAVGRSGTTLLERTLATAPGNVALGEVVHLWDRSVRDDERCGCGVAFSECPWWQAIGDRAFGGWTAVDLDQIAADRRRVDRNRYIPYLIAPRLAPRSFREAHGRLIDVLDRLYAAIAASIEETATAHPAPHGVLIDSSKHPSYLFLLRTSRQHDVRLLHVVRDPRGVAHSWASLVARPEDGEPMEQLGTVRAIARWTSHNLAFQLAALLGVPRRRMRYEAFTRDPEELGRCADDLLGRPATPLAIQDFTVALGTDHTVSGNPMRFRAGDIEIRADDRWRREMPRWRQRLIGGFTTPLRQVYAR